MVAINRKKFLRVSLSKILERTGLPDMGYLKLLEENLERKDFFWLCPLVLEAQGAVCWSDYCFAQRKRAEQLWPRGIASLMDNVIEASVRPCVPESIWPNYKMFIEFFYGLNDRPKVRDIDELCYRHNVWFWRYEYRLLLWPKVIQNAFDESGLLAEATKVFSKEKRDQWERLNKIALLKIQQTKNEQCPAVISTPQQALDCDIDELLDENDLFQQKLGRILAVAGFADVPRIVEAERGELMQIPNIGKRSLEVLDGILSKYSLHLKTQTP